LFQKFVPSAPIFLFSVHSSIENAASIIGMLIATFTIDAVGAPPFIFHKWNINIGSLNGFSIFIEAALSLFRSLIGSFLS